MVLFPLTCIGELGLDYCSRIVTQEFSSCTRQDGDAVGLMLLALKSQLFFNVFRLVFVSGSPTAVDRPSDGSLT